MNDQQRRRPKLIRANRHLRNKWLATVSILIFIPVLLLWSLSSARGHLLTLFIENDSNTAFSLLIFIYSLISILAIMLINAGMEIIQVARKVQQSGYFPAPDMHVVCDTWLISGSRAIFISYLLIGGAILLFISSGSLSYYFHHLLLQLLGPAS
jgi:hypothetical protein